MIIALLVLTISALASTARHSGCYAKFKRSRAKCRGTQRTQCISQAVDHFIICAGNISHNKLTRIKHKSAIIEEPQDSSETNDSPQSKDYDLMGTENGNKIRAQVVINPDNTNPENTNAKGMCFIEQIVGELAEITLELHNLTPLTSHGWLFYFF
jgi:hypothetical protein